TTNLTIVFFVVSILFILVSMSIPILMRDGFSIVLKTSWNPVKEDYGILPAIVGTIISASIALALALVLSVSTSVLIVEVLPRRLRSLAEALVDLAAAIPSVIYGLWGLYILSPFLKEFVMDRVVELGLGGIFGYPRGLGTSIFSASILLSIMVTPFAASIIRTGLRGIPIHIKEVLASLALTKWEVIVMELKYIRRTIFTALAVAYGRAVGETAAVAMVVGNTLTTDFFKVFNPGYTISSLIADQYPNAEAYTYMVSALFTAGLFLFMLGLVINVLVMIYGEKK
ncbi:MAG: phosphate ABC transporter permease subunit PstC, partial [Sulfolobales archaeon]